MNAEQKHRDSFGFTAYIWHEITPKFWLFDPVRYAIAQEFVLQNYAEQVKELIFAFEINPEPVDRIFNAKNYFSWKKGIICLFGKIPYQTFAEADEKTALKLMCEAYLSAILTIPTLRGMKKVQFDTQKLHDDLKNLFIEKGWV